MNNEHSTYDVTIKCEPKDVISPSQIKNNIEFVQIQDTKAENTCFAVEYLGSKYNMIDHAAELKKENTDFNLENSCHQSLNNDQSNDNTIEFVNVKVESKDDFDAEENSLDNNVDPIATKDGQ